MTNDNPNRKKLFLNGALVGEFDCTGDAYKDMEIARRLLKENGLYKEITKIQAMFRQALSFATAADYLHERDLLKPPPRNLLTFAQFVVNAAFSIELYLKTLHELQGNSAHGHQLLKLYEDLNESTRDVMFRCALVHAKKYDVNLTESAQFRSFFAELDKAFTEWRYCHETGGAGKVTIQPAILVMKAGHEVCKALGAT